MIRKMIIVGVVATFLGALATPAHAAGHVRHYTPSSTATVHAAQATAGKQETTKLVKKGKGKHKHGGKKKKK